MDLLEKFQALPQATSETNFTAVALSTSRKDFLAKSSSGAPIFLLQDASQAQYYPGVQFRHLTAQFHVTCQVRIDNADLQEQFALVACDGATTELHELFIRCIAAVIEDLPLDAGTRELSACIQRLLDLFRSLSQPSGQEVSGLWAELYVIANSHDIADALTAWHDDPFDRFDFSWGRGCLEVKASTQAARLHYFSLEQLMNPIGGSGYVASLLLQPLSGGVGVLDLAKAIEAEIHRLPTLKQKLWSNIAKALGSDFSDKLDKRFDLSYAERCLNLYAMNDIPRPELPSDPRVMAIRFTADLTDVASSLKKPTLAALRSLYQSIP